MASSNARARTHFDSDERFKETISKPDIRQNFSGTIGMGSILKDVRTPNFRGRNFNTILEGKRIRELLSFANCPW